MDLDKKIKHWNKFVIALFAVAVARLLINSLFSVAFRSGVDEGYYFYYALKVYTGGMAALKGLLDVYIANSSFWGFPVPLRFGFIIIASLFCRVFGASFISLAFISYISFFCAVFVAYWLSRRIFGENTAFLSGLLFLVSPLALALSRRALADSASNFFLLSALLLQIDYFTGSGQRWKKWVLSGVIFLALAFKETNILFIISLAVSSLAFLPLKSLRQIIGDWVVIYFLPVISIFAAYQFLFGSIRHVFMALFFLPSVNSQWYTSVFQSGPWFRYLMDLLLISPWVTLLGFYYLIDVFVSNQKKEERALALFILTTIIVFSFFPKNLRYVSAIDYPLRVFAVLALFRLGKQNGSKNAFSFVFTVVSFICIAELADFFSIFVQWGLYDPVSFGLLTVREIIPRLI